MPKYMNADQDEGFEDPLMGEGELGMEEGIPEDLEQPQPPTDVDVEVLSAPVRYDGVTIVIYPESEPIEEEFGEEEFGELEGEMPEMNLESAERLVVKPSSRSWSTDSVPVHVDASKVKKLQDHTYRFPRAVIAKEMVQSYGIGDSGEDVMVYKPASELITILLHGDHKPIVNDHPDAGIVTSPTELKGYLSNMMFSDANELIADLNITDQGLAESMIAGKTGVSIGFHSDMVSEDGIFKDNQYSVVQKNFLLDHLAIVDEGRCSISHGCGVPTVEKPIVMVDRRKVSKKPTSVKKPVDSNVRRTLISDIMEISPNTGKAALNDLTATELDHVLTVLNDNAVDSVSVRKTSSVVDDAYAAFDSK